MDDGQASQTAERVAIRRAVHQLLDRPPVFDDPLALAILRPEIAARLREAPGAFDRSPLSGALRAFFAVRSRFAEDALRQAVASGVGQYVILGAGFDTFAYRHGHLHSPLRVFEVDHPATQSAKRTRLAEAQIAVPPTVAFVPVDLSRASLAASLTDAGFDSTTRAFFTWLGVVPYLTLEEVRHTLHYIASLPPGTSVVFDYGVPPESLSLLARMIHKRMAARVAEMGEPWKTFFDPDDLRRELRTAGFTSVDDLDAEALNARYFADRRDGLKLSGSGRLAHATV